jgi:hypothetical protein
LCRDCLLNHVIKEKREGGLEVTKRQGRRRKLLLVDFKETRGYWELKEETPDYTLWGSRFERGCGLVVRQIVE